MPRCPKCKQDKDTADFRANNGNLTKTCNTCKSYMADYRASRLREPSPEINPRAPVIAEDAESLASMPVVSRGCPECEKYKRVIRELL